MDSQVSEDFQVLEMKIVNITLLSHLIILVPSGNESASQQDTDTSKLYELLNINKNASHEEVKKAFRKIAIKCHPDKGGDP